MSARRTNALQSLDDLPPILRRRCVHLPRPASRPTLAAAGKFLHERIDLGKAGFHRQPDAVIDVSDRADLMRFTIVGAHRGAGATGAIPVPVAALH